MKTLARVVSSISLFLTLLFLGCDNIVYNPKIAEELESETTGKVRFIASKGYPSELTFSLPLGNTYTNLPTPTANNGYILAGWYTEPNGGGTQCSSIFVTKTLQTFYANFAYQTFNIFYELDSGINNASNPTEFTIIDNISLLNPTRGTDLFLGWYESTADFKTGTKRLVGWSAGEKDTDVTLYARWPDSGASVYSINYNLGTGEINNARNWDYFESDENVTLYIPSCDGLTFRNWYTTSTFDSGTNISGWTAGTYSSDVDLYPQWGFDITYKDYLGATFTGTGNDSSGVELQTYYLPTTGLTLQTPVSLYNSTFDGWYTDSACTDSNKITQIAAGTTGAITLYAKWSTSLGVTIEVPGFESVTLSAPSSVTKTEVSAGTAVVSMDIIAKATNTSLIGDSSITSATITLYQGGVATTVTNTTDGTTNPSITLPTWLPADDTYQLYLEATINGVSYSGYQTFTVNDW